METIEKFRAYSPNLKDSLCQLYRYIDKFKDVNDNPVVKHVNFTVEGVRIAYNNITILNTTEKYATKFMQTLDLVKVLVDEQPTEVYEVSYKYTNEDEESIVPDVTYTRTFRSYDSESLLCQLELSKHEHKKFVNVNYRKLAQ